MVGNLAFCLLPIESDILSAHLPVTDTNPDKLAFMIISFYQVPSREAPEATILISSIPEAISIIAP